MKETPQSDFKKKTGKNIVRPVSSHPYSTSQNNASQSMNNKR